MKTQSVLVQSLCVPCACRCRHCLLAWDGAAVGAAWDRSAQFALRFREWMRLHRPELRFAFAFGYAMEPPDWRTAFPLLRSLDSPQAEFLQCDGMRIRSPEACGELMRLFAAEDVKRLNFTFYGTPEYHDRFAGRRNDFALLLRMMRAAEDAGLDTGAGIALTAENAAQTDALIALLQEVGCGHISLFIPHREGRGAVLESIRFSEDDLSSLPDSAGALLNRKLYRPEREWVGEGVYTEETKRALLISLRADNIERYEAMDPGEILREVEALDERYYAAFPAFPELAARYGDPSGTRFYRQRDLFHRYRCMYAAEHGVSVYDVTDERQSGSRRY